MPPTVQELYELWAGDSELRDALQRSLEPRGLDSLFDAFAALGPRPGELVVDVGARDARHAIRLVRDHGLRAVAARGGLLWGIYQLLGKLCSTVYVWERHA